MNKGWVCPKCGRVLAPNTMYCLWCCSGLHEPKDEPKTQMKTQNSNLTFEKDECAKEYEELGLKELKELIEADRKTENSSEKPNNCEHITEDGVTCAKYPACDDCLDNPLNKLKGSERLVKGSEQTDCQTCKWWSSYGYCVHRECKGYEPQTEREGE